MLCDIFKLMDCINVNKVFTVYNNITNKMYTILKY